MAQARKGFVLSEAAGGAGYGAEHEVPRAGWRGKSKSCGLCRGYRGVIFVILWDKDVAEKGGNAGRVL